MRFKIVVASYDCMKWLPACLVSIASQTDTGYDVCVVDDASPDADQAPFIEAWCQKRGWEYVLKDVNGGPLASQITAIDVLKPDDEDVIVFVDGDDGFADNGVLERLRLVYDNPEVWMTYGSYQPNPPSETCPIPVPYPEKCVRRNEYRSFGKWGIRYNHLRTVKHKLYAQLTKEDLYEPSGVPFTCAGDSALMIPCLELAGGRYQFISDVMYRYTSDNNLSEWRARPRKIDKNHDYIASMPKRKPLAPIIVREENYV